MAKFVIAWKTDNGLLFLQEDDAGALAVSSVEDATSYASYAAGYASYQRWAPALGTLDGAVVRDDELDEQFDENAPSPRPAFNVTGEAVDLIRSEAESAARTAQMQLDALSQQLREGAVKAAAFDLLATEQADLAEDLIARVTEPT